MANTSIDRRWLPLTKAGQLLLPAVMKSFDRLEYALDDIGNDGAASLRALRVQMPPSFAVHLAVPILRDFRRAAAEVEIDLVSPYGVGAAARRRGRGARRAIRALRGGDRLGGHVPVRRAAAAGSPPVAVAAPTVR